MTGSKGFTQDDVEQILRVVDGLTDVEIRLEMGDMKLHVRKFAGGEQRADGPPARIATEAPPRIEKTMPAAAAPVSTAPAPAEAVIPQGAVAVRAPMLGTFYRAPSPAEPAFVEVGSRVKADDPVCIVEVMKLFNTVNAGVNGTIVSIVAENGQMVEQDDILFIVRVD